MVRRVCVIAHRWVGLAMAGFLILVGLTGSILAFNTEIERLCAPQLFARLRPGESRLDLATLILRAQEQLPQAQVFGAILTEPDQASLYVAAREDPATGKAYDLGFNEFFVDPWTGAELGRRRRGDLSQGLVNLPSFIYELHWTLAIGAAGQWTLGVLALVWSVDCFVGFYLTLPPTSRRFWRRWRPAWLIKRRAGLYRLNFDLHRASGLWLWPMLFVFAWSSVMMDIRPAYEWVTQRLFDYKSDVDMFLAAPQGPPHPPQLDWRAALERGERLIAEQAALRDFRAGEPVSLMYFASRNFYLYEVRGSRDLIERSPKGGGTEAIFDGDSGELIALRLPTGERLGNTIESWLYALHMARVFGMPYRLFVCALGFVIALLSGTGVYIWWKKRSARCFHARRGQNPPASLRSFPSPAGSAPGRSRSRRDNSPFSTFS